MTARVDPELAAVMSQALALANRNYHPSQIESALWRCPEVLAYLKANGKPATEQLTKRLARNAVERVATHPTEEWRSGSAVRIARAREAADLRPWTGRTGPTDRRVLEAAFTRAAEDPISTLFFLSSRQWGIRAGLSWTTTCGAVHRLEEQHGALSLVSRHSRADRRAARYRLRIPRAETRTGATPPVPCASSPPIHLVDPTYLRILQHDAFRNRALGDSGWIVLHHLDPLEPIRPRVLAESIGLSWDRTRSTLGQLQTASIARAVPDGWVRVPDLDELAKLLDLVAINCGTAGALRRDAELYAIAQATEDAKFSLSPAAAKSSSASTISGLGNSHIRTHAEATR